MDPAPTDSPPPGASVAAPAPARPRGRRKWIAAGVLVLVCLSFFAISGGKGKHEDVAMSFVGFTNVAGKARAFLWVTNRTPHSISFFRMATEREGDGWVNEHEGRGSIHQVVPDSAMGSSQNPMEGTALLSFEVGEAPVPFRMVVYAREPPAGWTKMKAKLRQRYWKLRGRGGIVTDGSRYYAVTNEFHPQP